MRLLDIFTPEEKEIAARLLNNGPFAFTPITYTNSDKAQILLYEAIRKLQTQHNAKIYIFFDIDFDGVASGYIMWMMLKILGQCNPMNIVPIINKERKHGINDYIVETINTDKDVMLTIIVDSSSNLTDTFTKLNCDCVIIDHHDIEVDLSLMNGQTAGGTYTVVNNNIDGVMHKSATEVVYELWYNYSPDVLKSLQLEEWVAVSLYSDVIHPYTDQNLWFMSHLLELRPYCDIRQIVTPLKLVEIRNGKDCLTRNGISFQLVPLINSCMRMQCGPELVNTILYRPHMLPTYKSCVVKQKELVEVLRQTATIENYGDVILAKLHKKITRRSTNLMEQMQIQKQAQLLNSVHPSVLDGFNGLLATKISDEQNTVTLVYDSYQENDRTILKGSIRTQGKYKNINLRALLMTKPNWTASGHSDAFGFTYDATGRDEHTMAADVISTLGQATQQTGHLTRYRVSDYNFFHALSCTTNPDTVNDILKIAALNNLKTMNDRYYFEFQVGAGFIAPETNRQSTSVTEHIFRGIGPLRFKLTNYGGELPTFQPGETYEVYLEGSDGHTILGNISRLT